MSKKKITGSSQVSLCLGASVPEEQCLPFFWIQLCVLLLISKVFAIMKHNLDVYSIIQCI